MQGRGAQYDTSEVINPAVKICAEDDRFRRLLGQEVWDLLPAPVRVRFGKRLRAGESVAYQGVVLEMRFSRLGFLLAQAARLIGAPVPFDRTSVGKPVVVVVTEDITASGQFWIRQYGRGSGFPQIIHSSKRFAGPTGLEEYIGFGIGMALRVEGAEEALFFKSDHYFLQLAGRRFRLPRWLSPGALIIGHHELGGGRFLFTLSLSNEWFGELIRQDALFRDAGPWGGGQHQSSCDIDGDAGLPVKAL